MATEAEVKQALQQLIDYYAPKDMKPKRLAVYASQLQRLDGGVLQDAVAKLVAQFVPSQRFDLTAQRPHLADRTPVLVMFGKQPLDKGRFVRRCLAIQVCAEQFVDIGIPLIH